MKFEFIEEMQAMLDPVHVKVEMELRGHDYFVRFDGTDTYNDVSMWPKYWGMDFINFTLAYMKKYAKQTPTVIGPTVVEYNIGSVMDILKETYE